MFWWEDCEGVVILCWSGGNWVVLRSEENVSDRFRVGFWGWKSVFEREGGVIGIFVFYDFVVEYYWDLIVGGGEYCSFVFLMSNCVLDVCILVVCMGMIIVISIICELVVFDVMVSLLRRLMVLGWELFFWYFGY